jgi:hypothetical protein
MIICKITLYRHLQIVKENLRLLDNMNHMSTPINTPSPMEAYSDSWEVEQLGLYPLTERTKENFIQRLSTFVRSTFLWEVEK